MTFLFPNCKIIMVGLCILALTFSSFIVPVVSGPNPEQTSSFAMNSDGKGEVTVSCNGNTYKGEGMAACTSTAAGLGIQDGYSIASVLCTGVIFALGWPTLPH